MPAQEVAKWSKKARDATVKRDQAVRAMRDEGASLRAIAEAAGLSAPGVLRILNRAHPEEGSDEQ